MTISMGINKNFIMKHQFKIAFPFLFVFMMLSCSDKNHNQDKVQSISSIDQEDLWLTYNKDFSVF